MIRYLDTSAALKLLVAESESEALMEALVGWGRDGDRLVSSYLLHAELHCALGRRSELDAGAVREVLASVNLVDLTRADLDRAATSGWGLRTADSIHLAVSLRLQCPAFITYDNELGRMAERAGLVFVAPGR